MLAKWWINGDTFGPSGAEDISIKIRNSPHYFNTKVLIITVLSVP
jgi:hypothetical protein